MKECAKMKCLTVTIAAMLSLVSGCSDSPANQTPEPKVVDLMGWDNLYFKALGALWNAQGCLERGTSSKLTDNERATLKRAVAKLEAELLDGERFARSHGHQAYLDKGRSAHDDVMANSLNLLCHPDQNAALLEAQHAIHSFRKHVERR